MHTECDGYIIRKVYWAFGILLWREFSVRADITKGDFYRLVEDAFIYEFGAQSKQKPFLFKKSKWFIISVSEDFGGGVVEQCSKCGRLLY